MIPVQPTMHVFINKAWLGLNILSLFLFLEQEFAKNVIKTAEGAKTNVGHQVNLCFLEQEQEMLWQ